MSGSNARSEDNALNGVNGHCPTPILTPVEESPHKQHGLATTPLTDGSTDSKTLSHPLSFPTSRVNPDRPSVVSRRNRSSSYPFRGSPPPPLDIPPFRQHVSIKEPTDENKLNARHEQLKLSPSQIYDLTSAPESVPIRPLSPATSNVSPVPSPIVYNDKERRLTTQEVGVLRRRNSKSDTLVRASNGGEGANIRKRIDSPHTNHFATPETVDSHDARTKLPKFRPSTLSRSMSIPVQDHRGRPSPQSTPEMPSGALRRARKYSMQDNPKPSRLAEVETSGNDPLLDPAPSPMPPSIPLPPFSMPTYLQLELSTQRPSPLYIHRPSTYDSPYESSRVKFQRLRNFLLTPLELERVLFFGSLSCLDAWLYTFTILPIRFMNAVFILLAWMSRNATREFQDLGIFVYEGIGRLWHRHWRKSSLTAPSTPTAPSSAHSSPDMSRPESNFSRSRLASASRGRAIGHRRTKSTPSTLQQSHKADILQGLLIVCSCAVLMRFDASRMYHNIRGQAVIKLYVIYNVLEVFDRLFSALGQDILECLFSSETLERDRHGRSKVIRPFWMFCLALVYCVIHSTALFYQAVTLNVAVNSYSNALLTLLMSNQFVEIKGTVFKRFERENLFQLTCADVVERFQLWLMLLIIALRNIVEVGGLSISLSSSSLFAGPSSSGSPSATNGATTPNATGAAPMTSPLSILPHAFTIMPTLLPFQVLGPFLLVLGSEMLVDALKHAYITKFNALSPRIYSRFLDVLAKDYYTHAFSMPGLTKRLGLPTVPLACLFIRSALQTYHMFLATNVGSSGPIVGKPTGEGTTSLSVETAGEDNLGEVPSIFSQLLQILRRALGQSSFGGGAASAATASSSLSSLLPWTVDDMIALTTMLLFFLALYLLLLAFKLALGMALLQVARSRYRSMKERENDRADVPGSKRVGEWGIVEVGEDRRRWIYEDDGEALRSLRERERRAGARERGEGGSRQGKGLEDVDRYSMVAKRIW